MKVAKTHSDLFEEFQKRFFGIQRTYKPFYKQPIDLVLEQTINADAARRQTGIIQFTNSISARQRWALSHDIRSTIISYVYKDLDLQIEQDVAAELTNHNIKNNIKQLQAFTDSFDQFINPFDSEVPKDLLINILSGKAASETDEKFLLNIEEHGKIKHKIFIVECEQDDSSPENNGWTLEDNQYHFNWFDGDQLPAFVSESLQDESEVETKDADEDNENIQYQHWIDERELHTPPQSPDLNVIENVWSRLEKSVHEHAITSKEDLKNVFKEEWTKITQWNPCLKGYKL
ncbi:uncharacterized protein TNCV_1237581 [Trichonephila clavipes]|nr:uncharacterized protein TNCV_1237581 [Trichonephila clavipes]